MKKQNFKNLALNKKAVSNLQQQELNGGNDGETASVTFIGIVCNCAAPSRYGGRQSWCFCQ